MCIFAFGGCSNVTEEQGKKMSDDIAKLQKKSSTLDKQVADFKQATEDAEVELKRLRKLVDEAQTAIKSSADLGLSIEKLKVDMGTMQGKLEDLTTQVAALSKNFTDYRSQSDIKIEQAVNATTNTNKPPIPTTPNEVFDEGKHQMEAKNYADGRRYFEAFINRWPQDQRAAEAQYRVGDSYLAESRYANAIGAFTKLIDNFPKSEMVPDAMYKNGTAFYALKYCNDARTYFTELLKRYPKSEWKGDANDQLKKLAKDLKNKSVCSS